MAYNKNLYTSSTSALDAGIVYDQTETKMQSEVNAALKSSISSEATTRANADTALQNTLNQLAIQPNGRITVPTGSTGVTKSLTGLTADHVLIKWNFFTASSGGSVIAENSPPQDMEWSTGNGTFTIKTGGSSTVYCQPVFALPELLSAT